jgi:ribosomal subunit interface protein
MALERVDTPITIGSGNVDVGDALRTHAEESIRKVAGDYFGNLNTASVHFNTEGSNYRCSVNMRMGALPMKSAEAQAGDAYAAFNAALAKVAKQLRRKKRELRE